jgi:transcription elongation factor GreA
VNPGVVVTVDIEGDEETYLVGSREDRHDTHDVLSTDSAMGVAVLGAKVGESRSFTTPTGLEMAVRIVSIALL